MPFVQILWDADRVTTSTIAHVRDLVASEAAALLTAEDPKHVVTHGMIDSQLTRLGPLDRVRAPIFVTLLAREEPRRRASQATVAAALAKAVRAIVDVEVVVEIVLTAHASSYDYSVHESDGSIPGRP